MAGTNKINSHPNPSHGTKQKKQNKKTEKTFLWNNKHYFPEASFIAAFHEMYLLAAHFHSFQFLLSSFWVKHMENGLRTMSNNMYYPDKKGYCKEQNMTAHLIVSDYRKCLKSLDKNSMFSELWQKLWLLCFVCFLFFFQGKLPWEQTPYMSHAIYGLLHVRAWYHFYSPVFNTISRMSEWASERYGIKNEWIKRYQALNIVIICLLHITCLKKSSHQVEVQESIDKTEKKFFPPNLTPGFS